MEVRLSRLDPATLSAATAVPAAEV